MNNIPKLSSDFMYAIAYDLDTESLKLYYGKSWQNAYTEVRDFLSSRGFSQKQGSLVYGNEDVNMVTAVLAVRDLSQSLPWLKDCVSDIRILQLMANDDLRPAL